MEETERPTVFVSCGQFADEERDLGLAIADTITRETAATGYFAQNQTSLQGVTEHILTALSNCVGFVGVMHKRGTISLPGGGTIERASVWIEQEIAIAAYIVQVLRRPIKVQLYIQEGVSREGLRDKVLLNAQGFKDSEEVLGHFRANCAALFGGREKPLSSARNEKSEYDREIRAAITSICGQDGLGILTFVISFRLIVYPTARIEQRLSDERLRDIVSTNRSNSSAAFPRPSHESITNLADGIEALSMEQRPGEVLYEGYRFLHDGLFVDCRVSPDDYDENRQPLGNDRFVRISTLLLTILSMTRFAAVLAAEYGEHTTATVQVLGIASHSLRDDTINKALGDFGQPLAAREDFLDSPLLGTPEQFTAESADWAIETTARCLRLLNYPASLEVSRQKVAAIIKERNL